MVRSSIAGRAEMCVPIALLVACLAWAPFTAGGLERALASGAVTALVAASVVLVFRAEEVVSFAQIGLAMLVATVFAAATGPAGLVLLTPLVLGGATAFGWVMRRWVFARLERSPRVIATLAGMLAMQVLLAARLVVGREPNHVWSGLRAPLAWHGFAIGAVVVAAVLPLLLRPWLRGGPRAAALSGAAGLLAGLAGLLSAIVFPSGAGPLAAATVFDLPAVAMATALVAAAIGGFRDPGTAVLSAFALSVALESSVAGFGTSHPYQLALMPLLSAALLLRAKAPAPAVPSPDAGPEDPQWPDSLRTVLRRMRTKLIVAFVIGVPVLAFAAGRRPVIAELAGYCLVGLSLMMLMGWIGQVTLGQLGFAALGAWITLASGLPHGLGVLTGALVGTILSPLVAYTAIRHSGAPAPVTSLTWGLFAYTLFTSPELLGWDRLIAPQAAPLQAVPEGHLDVVSGLAVVTCLAAVAVVGKTKFGVVLAAARLDPGIARRAGLVLSRARLTALLLTGFVAATGGGLLAAAQQGLVPFGYATESGVRLVTSTGTGGVGEIAGPIAGAVVFGGVILLGDGSAIRFLLTGLFGLAVLLADPAGLIGLLRRALGRLRRVRPDDLVPVPVVPIVDDVAVAAADSQM